jgi:colanic acid biosynthesis glycosyl transferase WcaI
LLEESGAGICIQPESPVQLARAVRRLYADPDERRAMGLAGREFVTENFDRKVLAARYVELLATVLAERRGESTSATSGTRG